jgi:hypothetical protein
MVVALGNIASLCISIFKVKKLSPAGEMYVSTDWLYVTVSCKILSNYIKPKQEYRYKH